MRITQQAMVNSTLGRLTTRLEGFERAQTGLATGKRIHRPSDDPSATNRALQLKARLAGIDQEARNAADGTRWIELADVKLQSFVEQLQRARELAVRAANPTNADEQNALASEVRAVLEELVSLANSRSGGRGLFAGTAAADAVSQVSGTWTYTGDDAAIERRVSDNDVVAINLTGTEIFGFGAGDDVFSVLGDLEGAIRAGDSAGVSAIITRVDDVLGHVLDGLSTLGAAHNRIEAASARGVREGTALRSELSSVEDVDVAGAIVELQLQEVAYQATLGALGRALQPSLIDFLR